MTGSAEALGRRLAARSEILAVAESCTGGLLAAAITEIPGSSRWFERGLVTYSNRAKQELLDVPGELLESAGAVSRETVLAMATGLMARTPADWGVAVTGIAGPGGGTDDKPVGLVWISWIQRGAEPGAREFRFEGNRQAVRRATVEAAMQGLLERLGTLPT